MPRMLGLPAEVYSSIDSVIVPSGIDPGQRFDVRLRAGGKVITKSLWRSSGNMPAIQARAVVEAVGPRAAHRPKAASPRGRLGSQSGAADRFATREVTAVTWEDALTPMPFEQSAGDVGWLPGPAGGSAGRPRPKFTGKSPGLVNRRWTANTSARTVMKAVQFSQSFIREVMSNTQRHVSAWQAEHGTDGVERAFSPNRLTEEAVELWYAARGRIAMLNTDIPAMVLWDEASRHYDQQLARACPYDAYRWFERHLSFGSYGQTDADRDGPDIGDGDPGPSDGGGADGGAGAGHDRFRKRRACSDVARAQAHRVLNPGQDVGVDDSIRANRHWEGRRVRHKAAVHTGSAVDNLSDANTSYFLDWREVGWDKAPDAARAAAESARAAETAQSESTRPNRGGRGRGGGGGGGGGGGVAATQQAERALLQTQPAAGEAGAALARPATRWRARASRMRRMAVATAMAAAEAVAH